MKNLISVLSTTLVMCLFYIFYIKDTVVYNVNGYSLTIPHRELTQSDVELISLAYKSSLKHHTNNFIIANNKFIDCGFEGGTLVISNVVTQQIGSTAMDMSFFENKEILPRYKVVTKKDEYAIVDTETGLLDRYRSFDTLEKAKESCNLLNSWEVPNYWKKGWIEVK